MSDEAVAQARRLHHHVMNGGSVTALDMSRLVQAMERMQAKLEWWNEHSSEMYKAFNKVEEGRNRLKVALLMWLDADDASDGQECINAIAHARDVLGESAP